MGIKAGRTVVSRNGHKEFLNLKVNNAAGPGDEINLSGGGSLPVSVTWTANQKFTGTIELVRNGAVVASKQATIPANGTVTMSATVTFDKSGWVAARRMGSNGHAVHTAAVFVTVDNTPVRVSAPDAQFYVQWMDNLLAKTSPGGAWNSYFPTSLSAAQTRYQTAKGIYQQIAAEAGGGGGGPIPGEQTIFSSQSPTLYENDANYDLGTTFYADFKGKITKVRLYTNGAEGGDHIVYIWRGDGTLIGGPYTWNIPSGTAGWKTVTLPPPPLPPAPVSIEANTNYIVAISNSNVDRNYAEQLHGLDAPITNGNLHALAGGGVWTDALGTMPTSVWQNTNYFRDVVFVAD